MSNKKTSIGGQALIEGIMMKGPSKTSLAVRLPNGTVEVSDMEEKRLLKGGAVKVPIIRGMLAYIDSMKTGYKAMMISADKSGYTELEEEEDREKAEAKLRKKAEKKASSPEETEKVYEELKQKKENSKVMDYIMNVIMVVATVIGVALAFVLFLYLPKLIFSGLHKYVGVPDNAVLYGIITGVLKIIIFVAYIAAVSRMKDIKRVFQYHGAEHKTIFCYEAGKELTVENVRPERRFHPRCGTSFLIIMLVVGIIINILLATFVPFIIEHRIYAVLLNIIIIPLVCGLGYELIKLCGRHDNLFTKMISAPGIWLQHLTVFEPDDSMIEVAIAAMKDVIPQNSDEDKW